MKKYFIAFLLVQLCITTYAQSIEDAKKMLYYERFKSAIKILEPIVNASGSNAEAAYWLGEAYLQQQKPDIEKAKGIINKALHSNADNGFLNASLGHIAIKENKPEEAKGKFITAEANAGKNPDILLAIAKAAIDIKNGESNFEYAITVLNKALLLKKVDKPIAFILMGNAYRKLFNGGEAFNNYRNALEVDPKNALAFVRMGKIYQTQRNDIVMVDYYTKAVEADPFYAPAYFELYDHYSYRDINKAKDYLDKYIANSDADCNTELFATDYLFRSGKYNEALSRSAQLALGNCNAEIGLRLKVVNAYCYLRLKDSINAKMNIKAFMQDVLPSNIFTTDYEIAAKILTLFPGEEAKAIEYNNKAFEMDSAGRVGYIMQIIALYKKLNDTQKIASSWDRLFTVKARPSNLDLYNRALSHMAINNYAFADSLWQQYKEKYPDQIYGYTYRIKCNEAMDTSTTMPIGLAVQHWENMVVFAAKDTIKYKAQLVSSLYKLVVYYVNIKKEIPKAIEYLTQYLLYDPTNTEALKILEKLKAGS